MINMEALQEGFFLLFTVSGIMFMLIGVFLGILIGAVPGLTTPTAIAILVPLTFPMDGTVALIFLASIYTAAMFGGSITAILINTPGTPSAAATAFDGHPMAKRGEAERALGIALGSSVIGGTFSYFFLLVAMAPIAYYAIRFGAPEMFLLAVMGLTCIAGLGKGSFWKALVAGLFGILISTFGISPTGVIRPHFDTPWLLGGAPQIPTMIGLLALSELFSMLHSSASPAEKDASKRTGREILKGTVEPFKYPKTSLVSCIIGTFVGALPAAGASIAAFLSYNQAKQMAKNPDSFGTGVPEGIVAPETANSASTGGALTTTLAFGIPGSGTMAVMMSAMMLHGMIPGPRLFVDQMPTVYAMIIALLICQPVMIIMGVFFCKQMSGIINMPARILVPCITILCVVGSFALRTSLFDVGFMIFIGIIGFFMKKSDYPVFATVLGLVLGQMTDSNLIRTAIRHRYDFTVFLTRPISLALVIFTAVMVLYPVLRKKFKGKNRPA